MRMLTEILDCVKIAKGDFRGFQPVGESAARIPSELRTDQRIDLVAVRDPPVVIAEARVIGEGGITKDFGAETSPFPFILDGDQDLLAVAGRKYALMHDPAMGETHPLRRAPAIIEMNQPYPHPFRRFVERRYAD